MTQAPPAPRQAPPWLGAVSACRAALALFTIIPVRAAPAIGKDDAARAIRWLPAAGVLVAAPAAGVLAAAEAGAGQHPLRRLLAAALAVAVLAVLTGGLHLDGLADTADGLGSRRGRADALAIMRRPDTGPFGVSALVFVLLLQVAALAAIPAGAAAAWALALGVSAGRVAVLLIAGPGSAAARPDGLGALVTGAVTRPAQAAAAALLAAVIAAGLAAGGAGLAVRGTAAVAAGLVVAACLRGVARRRLGGLTGDVLGAVIELCTAAVLLVLALS